MSAFDPKRTLAGVTLPLHNCSFEPIRCPVLSLGGGNEAARVHHVPRRRGQRRGRLRRARSNLSGCGASACYCRVRLMTQSIWIALRHLGERLNQLGWIDGGNIRIDIRWGAADAERMHKFATELVALAPDVILAPGSSSTGPLLQATRTIPIVFAHHRRSSRRRVRRELVSARR